MMALCWLLSSPSFCVVPAGGKAGSEAAQGELFTQVYEEGES
jgi:hypothetical protein